MGPCAAGTAYIPGLADFVPMVKGRGSMALAGPHLVRAAIGEDVTQEELGGSRVHCRKSGVGRPRGGRRRGVHRPDPRVPVLLPGRTTASRRRAAATADPVDRRDEALLDVLPESNRKPYDVEDVIRRIVDDGEFLSLKPQWAKTIVTCLARFGGRPAGHRRQPAAAPRRDPRQRLGRQGGAVREPLQRLRPAARLPPGRARLHGRHEGRGGGDHPPRREDAPRCRARRRSRRSRSCCARPTARATTS